MDNKNISSDSLTQIIINKNKDGFLATCSSLSGVSGKGKSQFEALYNLLDTIYFAKHCKAIYIK